jgi:uncharacterized SAM-binding protein YcdF (DUF218 family)
MLLSKIKQDNLTDEQINNIVFAGISDSGLHSKYGLVFGNQKLMQQRVDTAVKLYKEGRIKKIIFMGGSGIAWNTDNINMPESWLMRDLTLKLGILERDILIEDKSMNSVENAINTTEILKKEVGIENINDLVLVTSEFHLKRAMLSFKKYIPNANYILVATKDDVHDKDNWINTEDGRKIIEFEAKRLIKLASKHEIADIEIEDFDEV